MKANRKFLDWSKPLLHSVVDTLAADFPVREAGSGAPEGSGAGKCWPLSSLLVVVPTARGKVLLGDRLKHVAKQRKVALHWPKMVTTGELPEYLYRGDGEAALPIEQTFAWARVLQEARIRSEQDPDDRLDALMPTPPPAEPLTQWLEIAAMIRRTHEALAAQAIRFDECLDHCVGPRETQSWRLLNRLYPRYVRTLADAGLIDPHHERLRAMESGNAVCGRTVVLVGTTDLNQGSLRLLADCDCEVYAYIAAPEKQSDHFDEFGRVAPERWKSFAFELDDSCWINADDVHDQAAAVAESYVALKSDSSAERLTLGVTDESHVVPIENQMRSIDATTYRHLGWNLAQTAIGRLLRQVAALVATPTWDNLATLVRHADAFHRFGRDASLAHLDSYLSEHFPVRIDDPPVEEALPKFADVIKAKDAIVDWIKPLSGRSPQTLSVWCGIAADWLRQTYEVEPLEDLPDVEPTDSVPVIPFRSSLAERKRSELALAKTLDLLDRLANLNDRLDLVVDAAEGLELIVQRIFELRVVQDNDPSAVPVLGWLDLPMDDAPSMIVTAMNHPFVPEPVSADPLLPLALRSRLTTEGNDRRYARDVHALVLLSNCRPEIRLVVGKKSADGSPTPPTRLMAAAEPDRVAARLRNLLVPANRKERIANRWDGGASKTRLPIPDLGEIQPVNVISVTAFKEYLTCPYRFYLRRVLKLSPLDDRSDEMAANQFGNLIHDTLEAFGKSDVANSDDRKVIQDALLDHLSDLAKKRYGDHCNAAVRMQIMQAQMRLRHVAKAQAERRADGWKIEHVEKPVDEKSGGQIIVDRQPMGVRGRFDRIDRHESSGAWAVLDYKTHGDKPNERHLKQKNGQTVWADLQLPLYRLMLPALGIHDDPKTVQLGYFNISDKETETTINIADFSEELMQQAIQKIHEIVRAIRLGHFEPTDDPVPFDDYPMILQTGVASQMLGREQSEVEEAVQ
ncbi:PD-(D/E)XK nuclease family protein [Crateriforma spongiae]|uniref:PD-(D/E)XK nuclease family protein n=1 Tax=Crateriforma spongiae TaxID=2724528 RepID=UPI0014479418|nr:PD-(D/E)XK nuclease family protein [Crateriforma spongiae]